MQITKIDDVNTCIILFHEMRWKTRSNSQNKVLFYDRFKKDTVLENIQWSSKQQGWADCLFNLQLNIQLRSESRSHVTSVQCATWWRTVSRRCTQTNLICMRNVFANSKKMLIGCRHYDMNVSRERMWFVTSDGRWMSLIDKFGKTLRRLQYRSGCNRIS